MAVNNEMTESKTAKDDIRTHGQYISPGRRSQFKNPPWPLALLNLYTAPETS